jgi:hypothetical protein
MKRTSLLAMAVIIMVAVFTTSYAEEVLITNENLHLLKRKWEGERSASSRSGLPKYRRMEIEIRNENLPLEGVITLHFDMGKPDRIEFKNGVLKNGKIFIQQEDSIRHWWMFGLYKKDGELELRGEYQIAKSSSPSVILNGNFCLKGKRFKVGTFNELFQWTAKKLNVSIDPTKLLPVLVRVSSKELQEFYRKTKGQSSKRPTGLYVDAPTPTIYVVEGGNDGITVHEITHYFQYRYDLKIVDSYIKDCQLVNGQIPDNWLSEEFWESHALQVEYDYCQEFGL